MTLHYPSATDAWHATLHSILESGVKVAPRKQATMEILNNSFSINMDYPITHNPVRKLSYKFMAAEAYWIMTGDDSVEGIAPYNKNIAYYSDDGKTFFGAYGPRYIQQREYIIESLSADPNTRQAVLTIWIQNPPVSKDVPCTVSLTWNIRREAITGKQLLNCHVFMRSSDAWLGLPYDMFNFSVLSYDICRALNSRPNRTGINSPIIHPGKLFMNLVSSHLYEQHWLDARNSLIERDKAIHMPIDDKIFLREGYLEKSLLACRDITDSDLEDIWRIRPK